MRLLLCILICVSFLACEKEVERRETRSFKAYVDIKDCIYEQFFDNTSYWVYRNVVNNEIHEVEISSWEYYDRDKHDVAIGGSSSHHVLETIQLNFVSSLEGVITAYISGGNYCFSEIIYLEEIITCNTLEGEPSNYYSNSLSLIDSIEINGNSYYNVVRCENEGEYIIYTIPGIGIIKKEILDGPNEGVYELIDYEVSLFVLP